MRTKSALIAAVLVAATAAAHARDVYWSIGIQAPLHPNVSIGTVFSNAPVYQPIYAPVPVYYDAPVYAPAPVYLPAPVYYRPAPVVYAPQPYYAPQRVVYQPVWVPPGHAKSKAKWKHRDGNRYRDEPVYRDRRHDHDD